MKKFAFSSRGFSLVEMMVAVGIMAIVGLAFATMTTTQAREMASLKEILARAELERLVVSSYSGGSACNAAIAGKTIDASSVSALAGTSLAMTNLPSGTTSVAVTLASVGQVASPMSSSLRVSSINVQNFQSLGPDRYIASLNIGYTNNSGIPLNNSQIRVVVLTDPLTPTGAKVITGCADVTVPTSAVVTTTGTAVTAGTTAVSPVSSSSGPSGSGFSNCELSSGSCPTGKVAKKCLDMSVGTSCVMANCNFVSGGLALSNPTQVTTNFFGMTGNGCSSGIAQCCNP